jgi:hypothetical protein
MAAVRVALIHTYMLRVLGNQSIIVVRAVRVAAGLSECPSSPCIESSREHLEFTRATSQIFHRKGIPRVSRLHYRATTDLSCAALDAHTRHA